MEAHLQVDILDYPGEAPDVWITFARLLTLTFRYSLVAQGLESDIVQDLFIRSHSQMVRFVGECYHRPPFTNFVNAHDTRTVVEAYLKRSTPAPKENPLYLEVVIAATPLIFHEALHEHQDTIPPLFNVMLSRLWAELVDEEPTSTFEDEWQAKTAYYAISVLKSIEDIFEADYKFSEATLGTFVQALLKQDHVNLMG